MQRKLISERTERFHIERTFAAAAGLRRWCAAWAKRNADTLAASVPSLPAVLDDRAGECWGVLLTIAEVAGGEWASRAAAAAVALSGRDREDTKATDGLRLLSDLPDQWHGQKWRAGAASHRPPSPLALG
jgi:hypothetical protein